ncbi:MAG: ectoine synthase [Pseudomonadota bacterium]
MIIRTLDDLKSSGSYREKSGVFTSARYLLRDDGMGFTLTETTIAAGSHQVMEYKNHLEANLIIEGTGILVDVATGDRHALAPGSMYALDKNDRHEMIAETDMRIVCVFTPALVGTEMHDEDGSYPIL